MMNFQNSLANFRQFTVYLSTGPAKVPLVQCLELSNLLTPLVFLVVLDNQKNTHDSVTKFLI